MKDGRGNPAILFTTMFTTSINPERSQKKSKQMKPTYFGYLPLLEFVLSITIIVVSLKLEPSDAQCFKRWSSWSPAAKEVEYHWETFSNIDLFNIDPTYFDVNQTEAVERAWEKLIPQHPIAIPHDRLMDLKHFDVGKTDWATDPMSEESVLALPEVFVQLGCLNFLRQLSYRRDRDYSTLASFQGGEEMVWDRAHQCVERLRQMVMCWSDSSVILQEVDPHPPVGQEGRLLFHMDSYHRCRNFERIGAWTGDNAIEAVAMDNLWWGDMHIRT